MKKGVCMVKFQADFKEFFMPLQRLGAWTVFPLAFKDVNGDDVFGGELRVPSSADLDSIKISIFKNEESK